MTPTTSSKALTAGLEAPLVFNIAGLAAPLVSQQRRARSPTCLLAGLNARTFDLAGLEAPPDVQILCRLLNQNGGSRATYAIPMRYKTSAGV